MHEQLRTQISVILCFLKGLRGIFFLQRPAKLFPAVFLGEE
jgi:hypothetical protein